MNFVNGVFIASFFAAILGIAGLATGVTLLALTVRVWWQERQIKRQGEGIYG